jgi:hypothetical protein
VSAIN